MADRTGIQWTDATWNPLRGCSEVSPGCAHCYAAAVAARFSGPGQPYEGLAYRDDKGKAHWTGRLREVPEKLGEPLRWSRPRMVFVNSMSDLFHEDVADEFIDRVFAVMALCPQHVFQVLTKRADRMAAYASHPDTPSRVAKAAAYGVSDRQILNIVSGRQWSNDSGLQWPLPNCWKGVSVEDQRRADGRIPDLLACPAAIRWVSYEPALGPVDFGPWLGFRHEDEAGVENPDQSLPREQGVPFHDPWVRGLDWVVCGGESGHHARPFDLGWARWAVSLCKAAGTKVFVKQLGSNPVGDVSPLQLRNHKGGDWSEWPADLKVREFPVPKREAIDAQA